MTVEKIVDGAELTIKLTGKLDTTTAPQLKAELLNSLEGVEKLIFNLAELDYLSSAGLRVLLVSQQNMSKQGEMVIRNANETIMEIFELTGFCEVLNIE